MQIGIAAYSAEFGFGVIELKLHTAPNSIKLELNRLNYSVWQRRKQQLPYLLLSYLLMFLIRR